MRVAWATDIHLNFAPQAAASLCVDIIASGAEGLLLGGDIAEAGDLEHWLRYLADNLQMPIWFVLGNHDYYGGSISEVRDSVRKLTQEVEHLIWLSESEPIALTARTTLVGHGGWGDHRAGNVEATPIRLNDHRLIQELSGLERKTLTARLRALGDQGATHLNQTLSRVNAPQVVILTHVPPFHAACWHEGALSNEDWQPDFICVATGRVLMDRAKSAPDRQFITLCGHTHGDGDAKMLDNLIVHTGAAEYGSPAIARLIEL